MLTSTRRWLQRLISQVGKANPRFRSHRSNPSLNVEPLEIRCTPVADILAALTNEVVFIDSSVSDYEGLLERMSPDTQVVILDSTQDGLTQIERALDGRSDLDAIHLIAHGGVGTLQLGDSVLSTEDFRGAYADRLAKIGEALSPQGDLLVYACDFGQGIQGAEAIRSLAIATGADVAASTNKTGAADRGGDWDLEARVGLIEASVIVDPTAQHSWRGLLGDDLTIEIQTAPNFVVDSNLQTGPTAAYLQATFTNTGDTTLTNVFVYTGDYIDGTSDTAGLYPTVTTPEFGGDPLSGTFSLTHVASRQDATRYVGTLAPGESVVHYWLVSYPWTDADGTPVFRANADTTDDLTLTYDIWATADGDFGSLTEVQTGEATLRNEISAMANKIWPNTTSKVPTEYLDAFEAQLGWRPDQIAPGTARTEGVWYDMGRVVKGFDADNNLIPDYDVWMQPVGNPDNFDPDAWMMVRSYGVLIVSLNDGTEQVIAFEDQLYHKDLPANNTGVVGLVFYEFAPIGFGPGDLSPYQEAASGSNNEKFNGDYGTLTGGPQGGPPLATIDKEGPDFVSPGTTVTYTLQATNLASVAFGLNQVGLAPVISEAIPVGTFYSANSADDNLPAIVDIILFSTDGGLTWTSVEPPANSVTNIQWWLERPLDPSETVTVQFDLVIPAGYLGTQVTNTGTLGLGGASTLYTDTEVSLITGTLSVSGTVWLDNGSGGGISGDGIRQAGETSYLGNINVVLYSDINGNGILDPSEQTSPRASTVSAAGTGAWSFNNLPDGDYIVQVEYNDPDRPTGHILSTTDEIALTLSGSSQSGFEFAFAPTLDVDKYLLAPTPLLEGTTVTYGIDITNLIKPDGYVPGTSYNGNVFFTNNTTTLNRAPGTPVPAAGAIPFLSSLASPPTEIAFDERNGHIYLGYGSTGIIERRNLDGSGVVTVATGQSSLSGLAVDTVRGVVYWTQAGNVNSINSRNGDGTGAINTLAGLNKPEGVAIDPFTSTVYWVETQSNRLLIRQSDLTFAAVRELFASTSLVSNHNPRDLEIDPLRGKLYWVDDASGTNSDFIGVVNLNGTGLQQYITNTTGLVQNPQGLGIDIQAGKLFWSSSNGIVTAPVVGGAGTAQSFLSGASFGDIEVPGRFYNPGTFDPNESLTIVPLTDDYDPTELRFVSASIAPDSVDIVNGLITWNNIGTIHAGATETLYVTFEVLEPPGNATNLNVDNTATVQGAEFANGLEANDDTDIVIVTVEPTATIGNTVWSDKNGNGTQDAGEFGIPFVRVDLFDSTGTVRLQTTYTDANGNYEFTGVRGTAAGQNYSVRVDTTSLPAGFSPTYDSDGTGTANRSTATIIDPAGPVGPSDNFNQDFGYTIPNLFFGTVFEDIDGDGVLNATEPFFAGVSVTLQNSAGTVVASTTTASDGSYSFAVAAGTYRVVVDLNTLPGGSGSWTQTADPDGTLDNRNTALITVTTSDVRGSYNFGYQAVNGTIGDQVYIDNNENGVFDAGDAGLANITVFLYRDSNNNGTYDSGVDALDDTTTTGVNGYYRFDDVPAGQYFVTIDETDPDLPDGLYGLTPSIQSLDLNPGETRLDLDFRYVPVSRHPNPATIGDFIFYDLNGNGQQDSNETGIGGVTVQLLDVNGVVRATTTTSTGGVGQPPVGFYEFVILNPDSDPSTPPVDGYGDPWVVEVVAIPPGAGATLADLTADPNRDGVSTRDNTYPGLPPGDNRDTGVWRDLNNNGIEDFGERGIFVSGGTTYSGADFGYQPLGVVGDYIWLDLNNDGFQDANEIGLANVAVAITDGTTTYNTTTDGDGAYAFRGLTAGTWTITVTPLAGTVPSTVVNSNVLAGTGGLGSNTASIVVDASGYVTQVTTGIATYNFASPHDDDGLKIDFGYRLIGTHVLSGTVVLETAGFTDGNSGEAQDTLIEGITVFLFDASNTLLGSTQTDANGNYSFTNVPDGFYKIAIVANDPSLQNTTFTTDNFAPGSLPAGVTAVDNGTSANLSVNVTASVSGLDFAWVSTVAYDFGDLPDSYGTTLATDGARHIISGTPTLYLGSVAPDTEGNGSPSATATGDNTQGVNDEEGIVVLNPANWGDGADTDNVIQVNVTGSGWLVGWIDFDGNGSFLDSEDLIVNQAVTTGTYLISVNVPVGTFAAGSASLNARFRVFTSEPALSQLAFAGSAVGGEVEDYRFDLGASTPPIINVVKGGPTTVSEGGASATFTYQVSTTGEAIVGSTITLVDDAGTAGSTADDFSLASGVITYQSGDTDGDGILDIGETWLYASAAQSITLNAFETYTNIVTVTGEDDDGTSSSDTDDHTITATDTPPVINVVKSGPTTISEGGASATFTYQVSTTGEAIVGSTITLVDDAGTAGTTADDFSLASGVITYQSGDSDGDGILDIGETWLYTSAPRSITLNAFETYTNIVTVTGEDDDGTSSSDTDDHTITAADTPPVIHVVKSGPTTISEGGASAIFTYQVSTTGEAIVGSTITLVDDAGTTGTTADDFSLASGVITYQSGDTDGDGILDIGETWLYASAARSITLNAFETYTNIVTVTGEDDDGTSSTDTDDHTITATDTPPVINVVKSGLTTISEGGASATFTYQVSTTGEAIVGSTITLVDDAGTAGTTADDFSLASGVITYQSGDTDSDGILDIGETWLYTSAARSITLNAFETYTNIVTVTGEDDDGTSSTDTDDHTITATDTPPVINVVKSGPTTVSEGGASATFTYQVSTTGEAIVGSTITLVDDAGTTGTTADDFSLASGVITYQSGDTDGDGILDVGETWLYTSAARSITLNAFETYTNIVTATGEDDDGTSSTDTDDHTITATDTPPVIHVVKSGPTTVSEGGASATFTYQVSTTGEAIVGSTITLVDDAGTTGTTADDFSLASGVITYQSGDTDSDGILDIGETWLYASAARSITLNAFETYTNIVTVTGEDDDDGTSSTDTDDHTITATDTPPVINVVKSGPTTISEGGASATFTYSVSTTGEAIVGSTITLVDDAGTVGTTADDFSLASGVITYQSGDSDGDGILDIGETWLYTSAPRSITLNAFETYTNIVTATGEDDDGTSSTDTDDHTITATDTPPVINVVKSGPTTISEGGASATFTYQVSTTGEAIVGSTITLVDDAGTVGTTADDFSLASGVITYQSGDSDCDGILDIGETWSYASAARSITLNAFETYTNVVTVTGEDDDGTSSTDTDDHTITATDTPPVIHVVKSGPTTISEGGASATFTYQVSTTGEAIVGSTITLVDDAGTAGTTADDFSLASGVITYQSGDTDSDGILDIGETWLYTSAARSITLNAFETYTNIVTATGEDDDGTSSTDTDDHTITATDTPPVINVVKSGPTTISEGGASATFTYSVSTTGEAIVGSTITLVDDAGTVGSTADDFSLASGVITYQSGDTDSDGVLDIGETWSYASAARSITLNAFETYTNIVTVTGEDDDGTSSSDTDDHTITATDTPPVINVVKSGPTTISEGGASATFTYQVSTTGEAIVGSTITLVDDAGTVGTTADDFSLASGVITYQSGDSDGDGILDIGETWLYTSAPRSITLNAFETYTNIVTVTGEDDDGTSSSDTDDHTITGTDTPPVIHVVKSGPTTISEGGASATFTYQVSTTGEAIVGSTITLVDDAGTTGTTADDFSLASGVITYQSGDTDSDGILDIGETWLYTSAPRSITLNAFETYTNVVTVTGEDDDGTSSTDTDDHTITATDTPPVINVVKSGPTTISEGGASATFTYQVSTTGEAIVGSTITLVDDAGTAGTTADDFSLASGVITYQSGDTDSDGILDIGETWLYASAARSITLNAFETYTNIVTATGEDDDGTSSSDTDDHTITATDTPPVINVVKSGPTTISEGGASATFTYQVSTTGEAIVGSTITLVDDAGTTGTTADDFSLASGVITYQSGDTDSDGILDIGETWLYTSAARSITLNAFETYTNIVTVTGEDDDGTSSSDTDDHTITATDTPPVIHVVKSGPTTVSEGGASATFTYQVSTTGEAIVGSTITLVDDAGTTGTTADDFSLASGVITYQSGDTDGDGILDIGETWLYASAARSITLNAFETYTNIVTATGEDDDGTSSSDTDDHTITATDTPPVIHVVKSGPTTISEGGASATFTYQVSTTGEAIVGSTITLVDDAGTAGTTADDFSLASGAINYLSGDINRDGVLDIGETWLYESNPQTITLEAFATYTNIVTATGEDDDGTVSSLTDDHTLEIEPVYFFLRYSAGNDFQARPSLNLLVPRRISEPSLVVEEIRSQVPPLRILGQNFVDQETEKHFWPWFEQLKELDEVQEADRFGDRAKFWPWIQELSEDDKDRKFWPWIEELNEDDENPKFWPWIAPLNGASPSEQLGMQFNGEFDSQFQGSNSAVQPKTQELLAKETTEGSAVALDVPLSQDAVEDFFADPSSQASFYDTEVREALRERNADVNNRPTAGSDE